MKQLIIMALALICNSSIGYCQSFKKVVFTAQERKESFLLTPNQLESTTDSYYYKIKYKNDTSFIGSILYPITIVTNENLDTLQLIKELLEFRGDTNICFFPVSCWNPYLNYRYFGSINNYSVQVEALFIINQLYFKQPFYYSPYPIIQNTLDKQESSIGGEIIEMAFDAYDNWFKTVEEIGLIEARRKLLLPFSGTQLKWILTEYIPKYFFTSPTPASVP